MPGRTVPYPQNWLHVGSGSTSAHLTIRSRGTAISQLRFYLQVARTHPIGFDILMLAGWMKEEMSMEPPVPTCDKI